jgi:glycine hydroxymethyltransferase
LKENDMQTVVDFVDKVLMNIDDEKTISSVKSEVKDFMKKFVLYPELD